MSRFARKSCINCSADLETAEDNQSTAFYNLNCSSRVRSPLSPATVELIPVPHALSTIFNFETLKKVSSSHSSSDTERDSYFGIGMENPLKDFESSASSVPICYVCYLVLSDLYRIYTEFSQLRKTNSFLGSKLLELENCLKKSQKCSKTNSKRSKNSMHPNPNQVSVSRVNASFAAAGAAPNIISSDLPLRLHPHQGLGTSSQTLPFHTHNELTSLNLGEAAPTVSTMSLQSESNSSLHLHDEVEDSPLDFVKVEVYQELDSEGDMDMENTGGVTEDEEGGEGGADYEDESIELPSSSFHLASIAEGNYAPVSAGDHNMDPLATQSYTFSSNAAHRPGPGPNAIAKVSASASASVNDRDEQAEALIGKLNMLRKPKPRLKGRFVCTFEHCKSICSSKSSIYRHIREKHSNDSRIFPCPVCQRTFTRRSLVKRHLVRCEFLASQKLVKREAGGGTSRHSRR